MNFDLNLKLMLIVGGVVAAIVALIVFIVLFRRYLAFRRRLAEMRDMKKDLMSWRNLNGLVRGGNEAREAKAFLSSKMDQVRDLFAGGLRLLKSVSGGKSRPWFVLVGEPKSGKTSLLARSGLELRSGVSPETMRESPLVAWLGPRAYTLDVAGRIFFDRWMKGSGAEWDLLVRSIRKHHRKVPLSGIILTIPADALMTDDAALTREKASIIGNELQHLLKVTGMNVPCHVVVTKLDMILGFREYFFWLDDTEASAPFGWQNPEPGALFDEHKFEAWFDTLDGRLRESMMARLLDPKILRDPSTATHRVDTAGASSLFPDALKSLNANLMIYMKRLFGKEAWNDHDQLLLSGVFFTAAEDAGVTISSDFAARCGKNAAEAPLVTEPKRHPDGRFIGGLLNDFIFPGRVKASYTSGELFRRQLPGYFIAALIVAIGALWLVSALSPTSGVRENLKHLTRYYQGLSEHLAEGDYAASPLFAWTDHGATLLKDEGVRNDPDNTRLSALYQAQIAAEEPIRAPFGFATAEMLWFSLNPDLAVADRREIFDILQAQMVFGPIFSTLVGRWREAGEEPFSELKRNVMFDYFAYNLHSPGDKNDAIAIHDVVSYLFPDLSAELVNVFSTYYQDGWNANAGGVPERYGNPEGSTAISEKLSADFLKSWLKLEIYGETKYPTMRSVIRGADELRAITEGMRAAAAKTKAEGANLKEIVEQWEADLKRASALRQAIDRDLATLETLKTGFSAESFTAAVLDYRERLSKDLEFSEELYDRVKTLVRTDASRTSTYGLNEVVRGLEGKVAPALDAEVQALKAPLLRVEEGRLVEKSANGPRKYEVLGDIVEAALCAPSPAAPTDLKSFFKTLDELKANEEAATAKLRATVQASTNARAVATFAADMETLMHLRSRTVREGLLAGYAKMHPHSGNGVREMVASLATTRDVFGLSGALAAEAFGDVSVTPAYEPKAAEVCFGVYTEVMELAGGKTPIDLPNRAEIAQAMAEYVDAYIDYWENFADRLQMPCADWATYRQRSAELKPYEINTLLAVIYRKAFAILGEIPKACLNERQVKTHSEARALIDARIQMLTPHFSDVCIRQLTNWSLLNAEPTRAYRFLRESSPATLVADYFAVDAAGAKGNIPWWTSYFDSGLALLKREARERGFSQLKGSRASFLRFPFCADPVNPEVVRAEELVDVRSLLESCGFAPVAEATVEAGDQKKAEADNAGRIVTKVRTPYRADDRANANERKFAVDYFVWGERMHAIVETLADRENETIWTLSLTPPEQSQSLNDVKFPELPIANYRYRYGELSVGGVPRGRRVALNSQGETQIARGTVDDADLKLRLNAYSQENDATDVTIAFDGPWAILRVYLTAGGVYDAKARSLDVPVFVRDRYDLTSVLWIRLKINRAIPKPSEWPDTASWPDLPVK